MDRNRINGTTILNIASGKMEPIEIVKFDEYFLVNLDLMYYYSLTPEEVEQEYEGWTRISDQDIQINPDVYRLKKQVKVNEDAFKFMECSSLSFDLITCYRFLEHVRKTDIQYFIYLMSTSLKMGGEVDIIVPNYETLAKMLLEEDVGGPSHAEWEQHDTILTFEMLNEPGNPHASIWTAERLDYFFTLEGRFQPIDCIPNYLFDGRDCYLRYTAKRIK